MNHLISIRPAPDILMASTSGRHRVRTSLASLTQASARLLCYCSLAAALSSVHAITIVDTGSPTSGSSIVTYLNGALAAEFTVANDSQITDVQGFLNVGRPGNLTIAVYGDGGDIPGAELFSTSISLSTVSGTSAWQGASGLTWNLASGTYWVGFQADPTLSFGMPTRVWGSGGGAPNPLGNEARLYDGGFSGYYWWPDSDDDLDFGVRILGWETHAAMPDTGSMLALSAIGWVAVVGLRLMRLGRVAPAMGSASMRA